MPFFMNPLDTQHALISSLMMFPVKSPWPQIATLGIQSARTVLTMYWLGPFLYHERRNGNETVPALHNPRTPELWHVYTSWNIPRFDVELQRILAIDLDVYGLLASHVWTYPGSPSTAVLMIKHRSRDRLNPTYSLSIFGLGSAIELKNTLPLQVLFSGRHPHVDLDGKPLPRGMAKLAGQLIDEGAA